MLNVTQEGYLQMDGRPIVDLSTHPTRLSCEFQQSRSLFVPVMARDLYFFLGLAYWYCLHFM